MALANITQSQTFAVWLNRTNSLITEVNKLTDGNITPTIVGGSINGTPIGGSSASTGSFTTISLASPLSVANGGTGATNATDARTNLGVSNASNLTSGTLPSARLSGTYAISISGNAATATTATTAANVSGVVALVNGGTGASTASAARTALGLEINTDVQAYFGPVDTTTPPTVGDTLTWNGTIWVPLPAGGAKFVLQKADPESVALSKTGAGTAEIKAGTEVVVSDTLVEFSTDTAIMMPGTLTAGTDYAVWVKDDGTIQADASHTAAPGAGLWRKIGGFHYAPSNLDIDSTDNINAYSMWDLKFRPTCPDPRGMVLVAGSFWCDIYLCNTDPDTNGTSKLGVTIADGSSPPKIPLLFGGDGTTLHGGFTWYEGAEIMMAHGKQLLSYDEFAAAMYGTTEASSIGTDQVTTQHNAGYTSQFGIEQATGVMYVWGQQLGGPDSGAAWSASTEGRGSVYNQPNAARLGGFWGNAASSGSRCAIWDLAPSVSYDSIGARGRSDHYGGI